VEDFHLFITAFQNNLHLDLAWWHTTIIKATQEVEIEYLQAEGQKHETIFKK
jgi:hypothetical protein